MSQSAENRGHHHTQPVERDCKQYSIHKKGNSLTMTIPRRVPLPSHSVVIREAFYLDRVIYLRVIPLTVATPSDFSKQCVKTIDGDQIIERKIDFYAVREEDRSQWLTIPDKRSTDRFARNTNPLLVSAHTASDVAYLKLIPECLYTRADSSATTDLIAVEKTTSVPSAAPSTPVP